MTAWWTGNATVFDLETDGPEPTEARIITAYVGEVRAAGVAPSNWTVKPERPIPDEATAVHGITTETAESLGQDRHSAVEQIAAALAYGAADPQTFAWGKVPVVGHNLAYDLTLLDREMRRLKIGRLITEPSDNARSGVTVIVRGEPVGAFWVIDTMVLDKGVDPFRPGPVDADGNKLGGGRKLDYVAGLYGVPIQGDAHEASADALAAGRVAWAIARRAALATGDDEQYAEFMKLYGGRRKPRELAGNFAALSHCTLPELHEWQRQQAQQQAEGLRSYFAQNPDKGDPATVDGRWPIRPLSDRPVDVSTDLV